MNTPKFSASIYSSTRHVPHADTALDDELDQLLGDLGHTPVDSISVLKARADKKGNVRFAEHEVSKLLGALGEISVIQAETGHTLNVLSIATRHLAFDRVLSHADAKSLSGVAFAQAERAHHNAERIRSLFSEINTCPRLTGEVQTHKDN